jgi:hypothetical protein
VRGSRREARAWRRAAAWHASAGGSAASAGHGRVAAVGRRQGMLHHRLHRCMEKLTQEKLVRGGYSSDAADREVEKNQGRRNDELLQR